MRLSGFRTAAGLATLFVFSKACSSIYNMAAEAPQDLHPRDLDPAVDYNSYGNLASGARDRIALNFLRWIFRRPSPTRTPAGRRQVTRGSNYRTWQPVYKNKPLAGHGGCGLVHLWVCTDGAQRIIDRVIVKECIPGQAMYNDTRFWRGGAVGNEPRESWMANRVYDRLKMNMAGDERHVTECLGWGDLRGGGHRLWAYKLYFEFCEYGDLYSLIYSQVNGHRRFRRHRRRIDRPRKLFRPRGGPVIFPEAFLWHLFESLAKALVGMDGSQILHGDMQAGNVLFGAPNPARFKMWPTPKLADWGTARTLSQIAIARVGALDEAVALAFASPEQACDAAFGNWEVQNLTFSTRTNVWQLGMLMCCAMRLKGCLPEADWRGVHPMDLREPDPTKHLDFSKPAQRNVLGFERPGAKYSIQLIQLVQRCLSYNQINRPTPVQLLHDIQRDMVGKLDDMDTRTKAVPWNHPARLVKRMRNEWSIGSDFDPDFPVPYHPDPGSDSDSDYKSSSDDGPPARPRDQYDLRN